MSFGQGPVQIRSISGITSAEASPTTSSAFVHATHFPGADSIQLLFGEVTKGNADNTATVSLWLRTTNSAGTQIVVPFDENAGTLAASETIVTPGNTDGRYLNVPAGDWFVTITAIGGTTPSYTGTVSVRGFSNQAENV